MARRIRFDVDEAAELSRSGRCLDEVAARWGLVGHDAPAMVAIQLGGGE